MVERSNGLTRGRTYGERPDGQSGTPVPTSRWCRNAAMVNQTDIQVCVPVDKDRRWNRKKTIFFQMFIFQMFIFVDRSTGEK